MNNVASQNNKKYYAKRNFSQKSIKKFNNSLLSVDWNQLLNYNDANVSFTRFPEITNNDVSKCFPEKTTKIKYENKYPWMTQSLRKYIREKNQLSRMVILDPTNEQLKSQYKSLRNSVTSKLRNAELKYQSAQLVVNGQNPHNSWKALKDVIGLSSHHSQNVNFCINGNLTNDKRIIANGFNMFLLQYVKF